jgi:hypothetical protein
MMSNEHPGLAALPLRVKALLVSAALVVLGQPALPGPLVMILAILALMVAGLEGKRHA